ncbi:hypothetical protein EKG37_17695 [Robertmurraya yapensis]|uniref:Uncharacterized protein n=1 Tax=Bacillus yapensis TaxID=2492960 RepID=A0A3S0L6K1_9BACI|nr:hypothetical protein [Bacillus yapensis]RTR28135.1 hypothetical protein EKG37_17695 [Bacillus yapensis]TKS94378.1 hypothetical protein FAR12_17700 [Bacillus yapensis]
MRLILGFIFVFILSVIFSYFQGFIDFLIDLGIFPIKYRNSTNFDIMVIFVLYLVFMATATAIGLITIAGLQLLQLKHNGKIKKAKAKAKKLYGTDSPYFYLLDANINDPGVSLKKSIYVYETIKFYLYSKIKDWDEVTKSVSQLSNIDRLKLYHEAIDYYGLPDIPKEYGIFDNYSDAELAQFNK